ncbi:PP2C family protein-serine/threonine phosphatase [Streptomyces sp. ME19-01-6]|uniref:PP2C family protein-serine/threonine phosphatase n=1 Tax=Streptomyces sp. ME19-01-6 TaxID=3028686 RepID=UPI0029BF5ACF|nr:PP2C family protein-serine/threonine phosphatase [Streptomyces sp. ME19-01-6]MDX3227914.1 PP2C family protein-serine/threonine phosphatase [Streptomyces sp. ME19-01-6]
MRVRLGPARPAGSRRWSRALLAVPLGIILAVTLIDAQSPRTVHMGPFLIAAPAITASFAGPAATGVIGALAVAAQVIIGQLHGGLTTPNHQAQIGTLLVISVFVTAFRFAADRHQRKLTQVRSVAVAAQEVLLRPLPDRMGSLRIASAYLAAEEEAQIGGDLYAAVATEDAARLVIGDVRGKGLSAVGDAAVLIGAFRGSAYRDLPLPALAGHLGNAMRWNWKHGSKDGENPEESFVTALVLDVYEDRPLAAMVNCGHPPPLLLRDGTVRTLELCEPALPLGLTTASESDYKAGTFDFVQEDLLLLYTDGLIEARNAVGAFYPLIDRVAAWTGDDPRSLAHYLRDDLLRHTGGHVDDDAAIVVLARCPCAPGA